jgi:hypothetical protein
VEFSERAWDFFCVLLLCFPFVSSLFQGRHLQELGISGGSLFCLFLYISCCGHYAPQHGRLWLVPLLLFSAFSIWSSLERAWRTTRESLLSFFCFYILVVDLSQSQSLYCGSSLLSFFCFYIPAALQLQRVEIRSWLISFVFFLIYVVVNLSPTDSYLLVLFLLLFSFVFLFCYICQAMFWERALR